MAQDAAGIFTAFSSKVKVYSLIAISLCWLTGCTEEVGMQSKILRGSEVLRPSESAPCNGRGGRTVPFRTLLHTKNGVIGINPMEPILINDSDRCNSLGLFEFASSDWKREMLIVISLGQMPTNCYEIEIKKVTHKGRQITLEIDCELPPPGVLCSQVITYPMHVVRVKRLHVASVEICRVNWFRGG